jgi:chromosome segregation ATPase
MLFLKTKTGGLKINGTLYTIDNKIGNNNGYIISENYDGKDVVTSFNVDRIGINPFAFNLTKCEANLKSLKQNYSETIIKINDECTKKISEKNNELIKLKNESIVLKKTNSTLNKSIRKFETTVTGLTNKLNLSNTRIANLRNDKIILKKNITDFENKIKNKDFKITKIKQELKNEKDKLIQITNENDELKTKLLELEQMIILWTTTPPSKESILEKVKELKISNKAFKKKN